MQIHLFSTDVSVLSLLDYLADSDVVTAILVPSNRRGSDKILQLETAAHDAGLDVFQHQVQSRLSPDVPPADAGVSWLYSQIIDPLDLKRYAGGVLNMHGGKIPEFRGSSVLHWAIIQGEREQGITWHECADDVDAGPIWAESTIPIPCQATAAEMRTAMIEEGIRLFPEAWARFTSKSGSPRVPDLSVGNVWPRRRPEDGLIGGGWTERRVRDLVRALCLPWPPATVVDGERFVPIDKVCLEPGLNAIPYRTAEGKLIYLQPATPRS
jgi:methionyl-tRNA formyltransferase